MEIPDKKHVQTTANATEHRYTGKWWRCHNPGKIKAREIEVTGNITVETVTELTGLNFINLGDTPAGYKKDASNLPKVKMDEWITI